MQAMPDAPGARRGDPAPRVPRRGRRPPGRDRRLGRRGAARGDLPRARRRPLGAGLQAPVRRDPAGRPSRRCTTRSRAGGSRRSSASRVGLGEYFPWKDATEYVRTRLAQKGLPYDELAAKGVLLGAPIATCEEEGAPVGVGHRERQDRALLEGAAGARLRAAAGVPPAGGGAARHVPPPLGPRARSTRSGAPTNNRLLAEPYPENEVWLNADAARSLPGFEVEPLAQGEKVVLVNQDGVRSTPVQA